MGGVTTTFLVAEALFLAVGILVAVFTVVWMNERKRAPTTESVARMLLLNEFPLQGRCTLFWIRRLWANYCR